MLEIMSHLAHREASLPDLHFPSTSTSNSSSPKSLPVSNTEDHKQKSQLCRSYMEVGMCPYQSRCKFAHGSHQLLRNNQLNMKYKTKECDNFKKNLSCLYGNRCNFIHNHTNSIEGHLQARMDVQLRLVKASVCTHSRLISLLEQSQI